MQATLERLEQRVLMAANPKGVDLPLDSQAMKHRSDSAITDRSAAGLKSQTLSVTQSVAVTADATAPVLVSASSSKEHGAGSGQWHSIPVPLTGGLGIESRSGGPTRLVLDFDEPVQAGPGFTLSLSSGTGSAAFNGSQVVLTLSGVTNAQVLSAQLNNVRDIDGNAGVYSVKLGALLGDVNGNATVNVNDVNLTKSRSGQAVSAANFRSDVNANGALNVNDVNLVKSRSGTALANSAPNVNAGADDSVVLPASASLDGTVDDDRLPLPTALTTQWTKVSGEGDVTFGNAAAVDTTASFSASGTYTLRLTATDGGALSTSDEVVIEVEAAPANQAPTVDAGGDIVIPVSNPTASLDGTADDDGLSDPPTVTQEWTVESGPGTVTLADPTAVDTTAEFSAAGTYILKLTATDGDGLSSFDTLTVTVNNPPTVNAGLNSTVTLVEQASLNGTVGDDALPAGQPLDTLWELVSGPGTVTFGDASAVDTTASFSASGTYVLGLTASDSADSTADTVTVTVTNSAPPPPITGTVAVTRMDLTTETSEKPQSKIWKYDGRWFGAFATDEGVAQPGTYVFELVGNQWQPRLQLSGSTTARTDVKPVGGVAHVLLYDDDASQLASIQYAGGGNYQFWSQRPSVVSLPLSGADETATIDIDGDQRMWIAYESNDSIVVQYSEPGSDYADWSAPITLATGVAGDDIAAVVAFPDGSVGVMWSNQETERFGFRRHAAGTAPGTWSANEVPGNAQALNFGAGMADDHINLAVASNGALYAAVKFSYDTDGQPIIGLLVRRPNGAWETHTVKTRVSSSNAGTRPIVVLNEPAQRLIVAYTRTTSPNPILYRESPMGAISFGPETTLIGNNVNNVTSTKQNVSGDVLFAAADSSDRMYAVHMPWGSSGLGTTGSALATAAKSLFSETTIDSDSTDLLLLDDLVIL